MDPQTLNEYFEQQQPEILDTIRQLVEEETPTEDKPRLDAFIEKLAQRYTAARLETQLIPVEGRGNHLLARFDASPHVADPQAAPALILCHYDTVWPVGSLATHPFRIDEAGKAYGPGIFDMQSSLALVEFALRGVQALALRLPRPVTVLVTSDEEVGSQTSRRLIEEQAQQAAYALVMESPLPGGVLKTARKGGAHFTLNVRGRAAHAGVEPEKGISAVQELAHQILALHSLTDLEAGTTVNVGVVSAGTRPNVIAAQAQALIDVRAWTKAEMARVSEAILSLEPFLPGAQVEVAGGENRPPLERAVTGELFEQAQAIGQTLGLGLEEGGTGGGSDGNLTGALGVPTLDGLGVPGHGAHADHEHIEVEQIAGRAALLTALLLNLTPPKRA